ncbi:MAG: formate dehydrogenase accessory sulfurtransferase FdhD [Candidatus Bipolaricaulota bacterium]|nr:MAG: formate dehydrogenase accessory sulfurtransferase FdhD [Candidatus Bipolaricaulota bacterium]
MAHTDPPGNSGGRSAGTDYYETLDVTRIRAGSPARVPDELVREHAVELTIDNEPPVVAVCSPADLREWIYGYLFSEGRIAAAADVVRIDRDDSRFRVVLRDVPAPAELPPVISSKQCIPLARVQQAMAEAVAAAPVFPRTGGTHFAAIVDAGEIRILVEDISRSCALEKALGRLLLEGASSEPEVLLLSSRVPTRLLLKAARASIPIVAAVSAATVDAVRLAEALGICLCGFVREERATIYTHPWRLELP